MNGETSAPLYLGTGSSKKKRRRDRNGEPSRGKPVSKKWKPVWLWLQSLKRTEIVEPSEVIAWLDNNPAYAAEIRQHHTNGVFVAYAQKCHQRLIFGQYHNKVETKKVCFQINIFYFLSFRSIGGDIIRDTDSSNAR